MAVTSRRDFLNTLGLSAASLLALTSGCTPRKTDRPNILFCIADDWGWPHASAYGDEIISTPTFDRIANEGILFNQVYVTSPSCTPSRNSILTGQYHWRLGEGASLWSTLDVRIPVFPLLLEAAGYSVGFWRKSWGPGDLKAGGYINRHPVGHRYSEGFKSFLETRPKNRPFFFWLGSSDPHRPYTAGSGKESGMDLQKILVPGFFPDVPEIRSDIADYYWEAQRFDRDCGEALSLLEQSGELENTIVVMTGDHGMPFPRCKSNLYEMGVHVPLAVRWPRFIKSGRSVNDFVSFVDLAPTFLEAAGCIPPPEMNGNSLLSILKTGKSGRIQNKRDHVIFGKERHTPAQKAPSLGGYPCRGLRTDHFLYIRNFEPERWPAGVPDGATHPMNSFADCDDGPTKVFLMEHRARPDIKAFFDLSFARRPAEELYNLEDDPFQLRNLAAHDSLQTTKSRLAVLLMSELKKTGDPRAGEGPLLFDSYPYRARYDLNK
jgi:N-sulfoglucosamine sulfohydrolase